MVRAWRLYLERTRFAHGEDYEWRERHEWARLKGRLAATRVTDDRRLDAVRERRGG